MTTETKVAKNKLGGAVAKTTVEKPKTIFDVIKAGEKNFAAALPKHINSERFVRIALTQIRMNPQLAKCSQESLLGALMTSASLGLEPGVLGQVYLLPFNNKKLGTTECQLQLSYKGMIELLRRTGQLVDIYAYTVYSNDEFSIEYGLERTMTHKP
ncbi:MAG: recombinase RecT, partial [Cetobacterium sp.]